MVDEWSGFADLLANLIGKYASVLEIEHLTDHTGGGKHAWFTRIQAEQRYLPPLLGEKIGADLAGKDEQHSKAFVVAAVYERTLFIMTDKGTSAYCVHFAFGQG